MCTILHLIFNFAVLNIISALKSADYPSKSFRFQSTGKPRGLHWKPQKFKQ